MRHLILFLILVVGSVLCQAQTVKSKTIDEGGTGMFKAIAVQDATMKDFVIYRPKDLTHAHARCGALPLLVFGNGACLDTSIGYERMLTEVASHGYIVVAIGEFQEKQHDRAETHTESSELKRGLDLMLKLNETKESDYYNNIDPNRIAAAGHSCGGAQVLCNAGDPRIKTYLILNAGMGDMEMAGASRASLPKVHGPILYITGGPSDVAYQNARKDYERIGHVPAVWADHAASGHGGTYWDPYGGDYGRMVVDWLDWQLKEKSENADIFIGGDLKNYPGWTVASKNFTGSTKVETLWIQNGDRHIFGKLSTPIGASGRMPIAIVSHGFNGTYHFSQDYFEPLAKLGYQVYAFDFPCGSVNSQSDPNTLEMSIFDEQSDVRAIVNYFKQQPTVDTDHIVLIGESQGGLVSALAAADLKNDISKLVLIYPAFCIPRDWNKHFLHVEDIPESTVFWNVPMGRRYFMELRDLDPFKIIGKFKKPVQIVQGDNDQVVSMEDSHRAVEIYKDARLHVIAGAGHGFNPKERKESMEVLTEFLQF